MALDPLLVYSITAILGLTVGSFLNAAMWRAREHHTLVLARSMCVHCRRQLGWYENIPVFSFIVLRGQCRSCRKPIPLHYPLVELATAAVFILVAWHYQVVHGDEVVLIRNLFFVAVLVVMFTFDLLYQLIFPALVWFGVAVGLLFNLWLGHTWLLLVVGAVAAGGFFLAQFIVSGGRWIGGGDVRLGVMMGIWLGWPVVLVAMGLAYLSGAVVGIIQLAAGKKKMASTTPFGTYLAAGTFVALLWGNEIIQWYVNFIR